MKKKKIDFLYNLTKVIAAIPVLFWMRPKTIYMGEGSFPKTKGVMVCANHDSYTDPIRLICTFWQRRISFLATTDLYSTKAKEFFFTQMRCIPVDKQNFSMNSIHAVCDVIKSGKIVAIFPEGRITEGIGEVFEFKGGVILMASLADATIIPTYLVPIDKWYRRRITLVGNPIPIRSICSSYPSVREMEDACEYLRNKVLELKEKYNNEKEKAYYGTKQYV